MAGAPNAARTRRGARTRNILVRNGPNPNSLGFRELEIDGRETRRDIIRRRCQIATGQRARLESTQGKQDRALIDRVDAAKKQGFAYIIGKLVRFMRGGGALRDALAAVSVPFTERHQTYIHTLGRFRRHAHFADLAVGTTWGSRGQALALEYSLAS